MDFIFIEEVFHKQHKWYSWRLSNTKKVECFTDFYPASLKDANFKRGSVTCSIFSWMNSHVLIAIGLQVKASQRSM